MEWNELSIMVISEASLATLVPSPIDNPTCAAFNAGASFVPSPVTATTWFIACNVSTSRFLSIGRARAMILRSSTHACSSSSVSEANSRPVMTALSPSASDQRPTCRPISLAVPGVSPVTIFTSIPASIHSFTAAGTSLRTGSDMATIPRKVNATSMDVFPCMIAGMMPAFRSSAFSSGMTIQANPSVRMA